jgi:penicillin-binding protein 1A
VCGAWVGGEYRAIHFRTGELGQGSRTALPICGQFFESVMGDPKFRHYHAKFANPQDASITAAAYQCAGYYVDPNDSIDENATDSLGIDGEVVPTSDGAPSESQTAEPSSDEE